MPSEGYNLLDARPNGHEAKLNLSDSDYSCIAQVLLLLASEDGEPRNGAIKAAMDNFRTSHVI